MTKTILSEGVVHQVPEDLRAEINSDPLVIAAWEDITRNSYCSRFFMI